MRNGFIHQRKFKKGRPGENINETPGHIKLRVIVIVRTTIGIQEGLEP
jgi:hypothetical protein